MGALKRPAAAAAAGGGKRRHGLSGGGAAELSYAAPAALGLCPERLHRLGEYFDKHPVFAGSVVALARRGKAIRDAANVSYGKLVKHPYYKALWGVASLPIAQSQDTIFRVYSMTKIVTAVAVMQLFEKALFQLDDPVEKFLPKFANMTVMDEGTRERSPAASSITIRHLLTHTSGIVYGIFADSPVDSLYQEAGALPLPAGRCNLEQFVDRVAEMPLRFHPGTQFEYSASMDVLGRLVEVWSGQPFDVYLKTQVFAPLGMVDTSFQLTPAQLPRLATIYQDASDGGIEVCLSFAGSTTEAFVDKPPTFLSGGGGLYSSVPDMLKLSLMLAGKGTLGGVRLLGARTVELMTRNQLPGGSDIQSMVSPYPLSDFYHGRGLGMGFGVAVVLGSDFGWHCGAGSYFWQGLACTYHLHDPNEDLTVVAMASHLPVFGPRTFAVRGALATLSAQAIVD